MAGVNEPIDIFVVAAGLRESARLRVQLTGAAQSSADSAVSHAQAKLSWMIANEDLARVQGLAMELEFLS